MNIAAPLKSPFPYFGGKSRAASLIWDAFGDVPNYVEPFAGSLAVLLARPHPPRIETVNDKDRFVANFWRAVQTDADAVAAAASYPVIEVDIEARHAWLVTEGARRLETLMADPESFDAKIAGWWVYGACAWIGSGWCIGEGPWVVGENGWELRNAGKGVNRQLPHLGNAGKGVNRKLQDVRDYLGQIQDRLRDVRVACGDWRRVLSPSVTFKHGITAILLDPPYGEGEVDYAAGGNRIGAIAGDVREWAIANGGNPELRIALCGYDGQFEMPGNWRVEHWKARGGYSSTATEETQGKLNRHRERIWFSPHCIDAHPGLFGSEVA